MTTRSAFLGDLAATGSGLGVAYTCPADTITLLKAYSVVRTLDLGGSVSLLQFTAAGAECPFFADAVYTGAPSINHVCPVFIVLEPGDTIRVLYAAAGFSVMLYGAELPES